MSAAHSPASALLTVDPRSAQALLDEVQGAKDRGWLQSDLRRWFAGRGVDFSVYRAATTGDPVPPAIHGTLLAMSVTGLPALPCEPNAEDIRQHLDWLTAPARGDYDDALVEIAYDGEGRGPTMAKLFGLDEIDNAVRFAADKNRERRNVYVGAALRLPTAERNKRCSGTDFYVATAVPIDIDHDYDATRARMAEVCDDGLVVTTGLTPERRSQHWTRLLEPCDDDIAFGHAFAALVANTGADMKVKDSARIMRLGGTVSFPRDQKKLDAGYCTELTSTTLAPAARPTALERLQGLEPTAAPGAKFDASNRPEGAGVERDDHGRVHNGREAHFRNLLLKHVRNYQEANGADPSDAELWDLAYAEFSDPQNVDNEDQRWTSTDGQKQLRSRLQNTMRRLRAGRLARFGLFSIDTEASRAEAEQVRANREATRAPRLFAPPPPDPPSHGGETAEAPATVANDDIFDPWEKYNVPPFPVHLLPPVLADFVAYQAVNMGVDPAAAAMAGLTVCSGALDQRFRVKLKRTGDWAVPPRLWTMLVGDPSTMKTPLMSSCCYPLRRLEERGSETYQAAYARWKGTKGDDKGDEPTKPTRYVFQDITTEKVGEVLSRQDRGALLENDELSGWIGAMDKYSGGKGSAADRSFWAQSYNGGAKTIDRVSRGELYVRNLCLAFLGGIQIDRLNEMKDLSTDGLLQRFVPVILREAVFAEEVESDAPRQAYNDLVQYLTGMRPITLQMDEGARIAADEMQRQLFGLERAGMGKSLSSFFGKLRGLHGSLALVLHIVEDPQNAPYEAVPERVVRAASAIIETFLIPHAIEFYRQTTDGADWETLRTIASFVLTHSKTRLTASDFTSGVRPLKGKALHEVANSISPLVAGGWLSEEGVGSAIKAWIVAPGLRERFAARRAVETERKAAILRTIRQFGMERAA